VLAVLAHCDAIQLSVVQVLPSLHAVGEVQQVPPEQQVKLLQ
jgi:hypothetical protein